MVPSIQSPELADKNCWYFDRRTYAGDLKALIAIIGVDLIEGRLVLREIAVCG